MKRSILALLSFFALSVLPVRAGDADAAVLGKDLSVRPLRPGFWLIVSEDSKGIAANALLASLGDGLLLVDTPWTADQTERVLDWAEHRLGQRVVAAVGTHSHADRIGGAAALAKRRIPLDVVDLTLEHAADKAGLHSLFAARDKVYSDPRGFEVFYPGPGHTVDNVVVWFPKARVLHGGCLVKSEDTTSMGYIAEADLAAWPATIEAVRARYGTAEVLVPGHGTVGGGAALEHTIALVRAQVASPAPTLAKPVKGAIYEAVPPAPKPQARYVFYVHGRILELQGRHATSPDFGVYEYDAILDALAAQGFEVISEVRSGDAGDAFVAHVAEQVRALWKAGVPHRNVTIVGASKGGFLTLRIATELQDAETAFVVLAGCGDNSKAFAPRLRGRILSIYDEHDRFTPSCQQTFALSPQLTASRELVLHLGLDHGLLYQPHDEWVLPASAWANRTP